jgi:hypothetical protein
MCLQPLKTGLRSASSKVSKTANLYSLPIEPGSFRGRPPKTSSFIQSDDCRVELRCHIYVQDRLLQDAAAEHTWMYSLRVLDVYMTSERNPESIKSLYCSTKSIPEKRGRHYLVESYLRDPKTRISTRAMTNPTIRNSSTRGSPRLILDSIG